MVFNPKCRFNIVAQQFPIFTLNNDQLKFIQEFKYLGHMLCNSQLDAADILREREKNFIDVICCQDVFIPVL